MATGAGTGTGTGTMILSWPYNYSSNACRLGSSSTMTTAASLLPTATAGIAASLHDIYCYLMLMLLLSSLLMIVLIHSCFTHIGYIILVYCHRHSLVV